MIPALLEPRILNLEPATPPCHHFGSCGGCQFQDLSYADQLKLKSDRLRTLLEAAGLSLPELHLHPSPPLAYRNRIRLTLAERNGRLRAGYLTTAQPDPSNLAPRTSNLAFIPITQCPVTAPILWRATEALLEELNRRSAVWIEGAHFTFDQLELFTDAVESNLQISLFVRTSAKSHPAKFTSELASFCESVRTKIPALTGAGIYLIPPRLVRSRRTEVPRPGPNWGAPGLNYTVSAKDQIVILSAAQNLGGSSLPLPASQPTTLNLEPQTYWVPRTAFFQVNRYLLPELLTLVTASRTGQLAFDLYAGVGLFTFALAPHFAHIISVEIAEPAFTALASTKLPNLHAVKATTLDFLQTAILQRDRPDLIVLDPPRSGAGREVCALLARIGAPTLIYVSCSPEALPADLQVLAASGYTLAELHLFDLFPQTNHIETVAILTR